MLPKIIHYCWFGNSPLPPLARKCIISWKEYLPDYEIIQWNEDNFDVEMNTYTSFCFHNRLWAYLSDYVRVFVVEQSGGLYFDTDVELLKTPKDLLKENAWVGWETSNWVNTGLGFGSVAHHKYLNAVLAGYNNLSYEELEERWQRTHTLTGCPRMNTMPLLNRGIKQDGTMQRILFDGDEILVLPSEYLCPLEDLTGKITITDKTTSIHWYTKSANSRLSQIKSKIMRLFRKKVLRRAHHDRERSSKSSGN